MAAGRLVRHHLLVGPDGAWRDPLWLDSLLAELPELPEPVGPAAAAEPERLTSPLPVNSCSVDSLTLLPGVGPVLAGRIDAARREGLVFCNADDLQQVKGIGPRLSARLDSLVLYAPSPPNGPPAPADSAKSR